MAFQKKTWFARLGQGLNKFIFNGGSKVTLDSSPDVVTQEGTPLSAENMNDLEDRIDAEFTNINLDTGFIDITSEVSFRGVFSNYSNSVKVYDFPKQKLLYVNGLLNMDNQASADSIIMTLPTRYRSESDYQYTPCISLGKAINFVAVFRLNNIRVDNNAGSSSVGLSVINAWFRYIDASA